jgi:peroxiredoxin
MRIAMLALAGLCLAATPPRKELKLGEVVPDVGFKAYDGKEYKLSDFRDNKEKKFDGQVVVLYFHSEKCPVQIPVETLKKYTDPWKDPKNGVKFLAFFAYGHDNEKRIGEFIEENKLSYTCTWDTEKKLRDHFGAKQVNMTFVLDKTGKLIYRGGFLEFKKGGVVSKETVVEAVKAAKEGAAAPKSDGRFAG